MPKLVTSTEDTNGFDWASLLTGQLAQVIEGNDDTDLEVGEIVLSTSSGVVSLKNAIVYDGDNELADARFRTFPIGARITLEQTDVANEKD